MPESLSRLRLIPVLLTRYRLYRTGAASLQFAWIVIAIHILMLTLLAWFSQRNPLSPKLLIATAWSYLIYIALPLAWWFNSRSPLHKIENVARDLDHANPTAPDPFRTSLSLGNHKEKTLSQLDELFASVLPSLRFPRPALLPTRHLLLLGAAGFSLIATAMLTQHPGEFLHRAFTPWTVLDKLPILRFQWESPRQVLGVGDTAEVHGFVEQAIPGQTVFAYVQTKDGETRYPLPLSEKGRFNYSFGPASEDFKLYFEGENGRSPMLNFQVKPRPFLERLQAEIVPPGYTRLPADTLPIGVAHFSVLPGTRVTWNMVADRKLHRLVIGVQNRNADSSSLSSAWTDTLGPGREFEMTREFRMAADYSFWLEDEAGIRSRPALPNRVDIIPDLAPEVELVSPSADAELNRDGMLPLAFRLKDDFGISTLRIAYRVLSDGKVRAEGALKSEGHRDCRDWLLQAHAGLVEATWDITSLHLQPENALEFYLVAVDNDNVNGPKSGKSSLRTLRMRSMQELLSATRKREQSAEASLRSALQREKQLERKLEREKQSPPEEGPPMLAEYEVNRIMVENPHDQLRRAQGVMAMLQNSLDKSGKAAVQEFQAELQRNEPAMPRGNQSFLPIEERRKNLDGLIKSQKAQAIKLAALMQKLDSSAKPSGPPNPPKAQLEQLAKELNRNIADQTDLQKHMEEESAQAKAKSDLMDQAIQEQMRMAQDMQSASQDLKKNMELGAKNGLLSPELVEKMKKVDELMREVLPDSLRNMLERKLQGQEVDEEELRQKLQEMLEKQSELVENLNRALAMLEQLRDRKRMLELKNALEDLKSQEDALSKDLQSGNDDKAYEMKQKAIQQATQKSLADFAAQAATRKALQQLNKQLAAVPVQKDMQAVRDALAAKPKGDSPEGKAARSAAGQSAASATEKLAAMSQSLAEAMAAMENSVDIGEVQELLQESLALSRLQILTRSGAASRRSEGWEAGENVLYGSIGQTAEWLNGRVKQVAAKIPFIGSALLAASRNLVAASKETARYYSTENADQALKYNQNLSRELLKVLKMAQSGSGQGSGSGSGAPSSNPGGAGQGQTGGGDLAGQLQGISGKQMAINQATYQLLRAMMAGRQSGAGQSGSGEGGQSPSEGGQQGGDDGSGTLPGMANRQGELGENLESLAEALGEEGGAGQKLRGLADQARQLEEELRQGRIRPEDLQQRQERFQSRLLEAANAMQERGQSDTRQAETRRGLGTEVSESGRSINESRFLELMREARRSSKGLSLSLGQRKYLEQYYESLLTR